MPGSQEKPSGWLVVGPSILRTTLYTAIINPLRGLLARAQRSYAGKFWRIEVRSGKHKANEEEQASTCVLIPYRLPKEWHWRSIEWHGREEELHTFLGLLAKIKCSICSYQFNI